MNTSCVSESSLSKIKQNVCRFTSPRWTVGELSLTAVARAWRRCGVVAKVKVYLLDWLPLFASYMRSSRNRIFVYLNDSDHYHHDGNHASSRQRRLHNETSRIEYDHKMKYLRDAIIANVEFRFGISVCCCKSEFEHLFVYIRGVPHI